MSADPIDWEAANQQVNDMAMDWYADGYEDPIVTDKKES